MNKFTRKIAGIFTAAAVAFGSIGALPDTGVFPSLVVPASATSPWWVTSGEGTASSPYLISNSKQWSTFAMYINTENSTYGDNYYKLTADITVDTNDTSAIFVGGSTGPFRGHFDGGGHTLTFNYIGIAEGAAPFRYVSGATIENLKVTGTISINGGKHYAAGIAGYVTGDTTINNCTSSVTIDSSGSSGSGRFGGLVGEVSSGVTLNINNCVFNGSMTGSVTMACGGFVGYNLGTVNITDCLLDPGSIGVGMYSFVQDWSNGISSLTRAYRTYDFSGSYDQGIRVYTDAPANAFSKKVKIFTNDYYWQPGTAAITGVESSYPLTGDSIALPACGVSLDGEALSSSDYTVTVTNSSSQTVSSITDAGTYTLTVTGKGDYSGSTLKTFKVYGIDSIPYIDATGDEKEAGSAIRLESATLPEGDWWYVTGETTINSRISISGTKHLILTDGAVLNIPKGIQLASGNTLNIYGQSGNTGKLVITGVESQKAGIGGNSQQSCGTLTVNGGDITVTGGTYGAGIGGGYSDNGNAHGGTVTINGGNVTAKGGSNGDYYTVGIGGGGSWKSDHVGGNGGTIVINGGIVSATGFKGCAGMGGGRNCADKGTVTINWKNASDRVYASSYNSTVTVSGDYVHEGTSTKATSENIGGKTLVPAKKITIGTVTNGTIALPNDAESGSYFGIGSTVTLNVTPDISYAIESVKYGTTEIVPVSGVYSFVMPANDVTVTATFVYDPSHFSVNEAGTEYTIHDSTGWNQFCAMVNSGTDFAGKTVILGESIFVSTTAGTSDHKFKGTFDGGSNTLTFNKTGVTTDNCAPFLYIEGATIQNLNIAGNITTSKKFAASLAAHTYGTTNITNCHSTVTITSSATSSGDGTHGGFVAVNEGSATLNFTGCSFKGSMLGSNANSNGGFVGYNSGTIINYTDCLFAPSEISMSGSNSCTFNRNGRNLFTNTYYTTVLGTAEGKAAKTISADDNVTVGLSGTATEYDVSGITVYADNSGLKYGDTIYAGEDDTVSLTLSNTPPSGKTFSAYTVSAGTLTGTENPYTLTMPAGNVTVSAEFEGGSLETVATPTFTPAEGSYIGTQSVEISCETDGATIYYTTNGSTPTTSSTEYTAAIAVSTSKTIKAIAVKSGMTDSAVASAEYTITPAAYTLTVTAPTFDAVTAGYAQPDAQAITITSTGNSNATISSVALSGTNAGSFTLTNGTASVTAGGTNSSYTIRPNAGLAVGTYTATITVTYDGNETATADVSFTVNEATPTTYTVTYKVVNGTWADDTTADKTETVTSGANPSNVPTGMKASSGYTGGAWDTDPTTVTITGATTFTYTFTAVSTYTVTVNSGTGGGSYAAGASVTITAGAAPSGQQFKEWTGADGLTFTSGSATTSTATFTMPASAVTVTATYEDIPATTYTVTVNNGTGGGNYFVGSSVTIVANAPENGKRFKEWTGADGLTFTEGSASTAEATFTMPAKAVTVMATYENLEAVATPTFSPAGGTFTSAQSVTISCATSGATIYYTTDGTTPTTSSSIYSSAIAVSTTTTIKAIAVKAGMTTSSVASATYTINTPATVATPTFSPAGGTYTSAQSVTISCATSGATIYYTTNGTTPTTSSSIYSSAVAISATTTIKAIAVKAGMTTSLVASATYTINTPATVATPTFSPAGGTYTSAQNVTISCATSGATIYYTTDGSTPTTSSAVYSSAIAVSTSKTIKAIAVKSGMTNSSVASATYTITPATYTLTVTAPTFDTVSVGYAQPAAKAITITSTGNSNATISSVELSGTNADSFTLTNGTASVTAGGTNTSYTIRPNAGLAAGTYIATITVTYNGEATATANVSFTVNALDVVATPTFSPAGGTYTSAQSVTISCATSGATIYYTTDGTTPTTISSVYSSAISVSTTTTIKAIAVKAGMTNSAIATATYSFSSVHSHSYTSVVTSEPTCTTTGLRTYTCSGCGDSYTEVIPALGHNYTSAVTTEPTCTTTGVRTYTCSRCGDSYTEVIPLAAHKYTTVRENEVAPDCIHAGSYDEVEKCSVCGNVKSRTTKTVPALGHDFVNGKCTRCGAVEMTTGDLPSIIENNEEETVILALEADTDVSTLKFPKNVKEIIIDGCGHTLDFTGTASIKPSQKLTLVNITIKAEKNGKKQSITLTASAGDLVLENVTFDGKKTTITATKGDLTLDNVSANNLTVKGAAKKTLTVEGDVSAVTISGFGNIKEEGSLTVTKTLKVNALDLSEDAVLNVVKGAVITLSKGISGNGEIYLASGFKAITINGKATGNIRLTGDKMTDGQLIFKSKLTNLNDVFDVSGIAPEVTDGEYSYGLYAKSGKVYLRAFKMQVGDTTYCELSDVLNGINKSKEKGKSYELDLLGDIDFGKTFKLPTKGKYNSLSIDGNGHSISFNGTTLTLTGNLTLKNVKITAMKNGKPVAWTIKKKKYELVTENAELENCKVE